MPSESEVARNERHAFLVHMSRWLPIPFGSGGSMVMWRDLEALRAAGYRVTCFAVGDKSAPLDYPAARLEELPPVRTVPVISQQPHPDGRLAEWVRPLGGLLRRRYPPDLQSRVGCSATDFSEGRPDLVVAENPSACAAAMTLWPGSRTVLVLHDDDALLAYAKYSAMIRPTWTPPRRAYRRAHARWVFALQRLGQRDLMQKCAGVVALGRHLVSYIAGFHHHVAFAPCAIPEPSGEVRERVIESLHRAPGGAQQTARILYVGNLKNSHTQVSLPFLVDRIVPRLRAALGSDAFALRIVGSASGNDNLRAKYEDVPNVEFAGFVQDLGEEYLSATCQVVPAGLGTGIRVKIPESLSYGLPVVTSTCEADALGLSERDGCVVADDPEAFTRSIVRLVLEPAFRLATGRDGLRAYGKKFSPQAVIPPLARWFARVPSSEEPAAWRDEAHENTAIAAG